MNTPETDLGFHLISFPTFRHQMKRVTDLQLHKVCLVTEIIGPKYQRYFSVKNSS